MSLKDDISKSDPERGYILEDQFHHYLLTSRIYYNGEYEIITEDQLKGIYYDEYGKKQLGDPHPLYYDIFDLSRKYNGGLYKAGTKTPDYIIFNHYTRRAIIVDITLNKSAVKKKHYKYTNYKILLNKLTGYNSEYMLGLYSDINI